VLDSSCASGNLPFALTTDQRGAGFTRKYGAAVDIGAFERQFTPRQLIENLAAQIQNLDPPLPPGTEKSLLNKLNEALAALDAGDTVLAQSKLQDFINQVNAQSGKKIPTGQASTLINAAREIQTAIGA
jgi:hypothetical protein